MNLHTVVIVGLLERAVSDHAGDDVRETRTNGVAEQGDATNMLAAKKELLH